MHARSASARSLLTRAQRVAVCCRTPDKDYYSWLLVKVLRFVLRQHIFAGPENWYLVKQYFAFVTALFELGERLRLGVELLPQFQDCSVFVRVATPEDKVEGKAAAPSHVAVVRFHGMDVMSVRMYATAADKARAAEAAPAAPAGAAAAPAPADDAEFEVVVEPAELAERVAMEAAHREASEENGDDAAGADWLENDDENPADELPQPASVQPLQDAGAVQMRSPFHLAVVKRNKARAASDCKYSQILTLLCMHSTGGPAAAPVYHHAAQGRGVADGHAAHGVRSADDARPGHWGR